MVQCLLVHVQYEGLQLEKNYKNVWLVKKCSVSRDGGETCDERVRLCGWSSGCQCKPWLTHPVQTEGPYIDGTHSGRQAPLPCGSQQLKRGHGGAEGGREVRGEKLGEKMVKRGKNVVHFKSNKEGRARMTRNGILCSVELNFH